MIIVLFLVIIMTLYYNFKIPTLAVQTPALFDDIPTFTMIPYLDEYNNMNIENAMTNAIKELDELHEDSRTILLGYISELKFTITNKDYNDSNEIKVIEKFAKDLYNKDFKDVLPEMIVFKCFPYAIDLPLQYGYIVNKYTEIEKYNMYLLDKHQFVIVNEIEFEFKEDDVLNDEFLNTLIN